MYADPNIDAVYISLPTGLRAKECINAAKHGKHILTEKPCGISTKEVEEMIAVCDENNVQLMNGVCLWR